jgi:hypothetical protein
MTTAELSKRIEEKAAERTRYAREVWGAPPHIALEVEPRIAQVNKEIRELQMQLHFGGTSETTRIK